MAGRWLMDVDIPDEVEGLVVADAGDIGAAGGCILAAELLKEKGFLIPT